MLGEGIERGRRKKEEERGKVDLITNAYVMHSLLLLRCGWRGVLSVRRIFWESGLGRGEGEEVGTFASRSSNCNFFSSLEKLLVYDGAVNFILKNFVKTLST